MHIKNSVMVSYYELLGVAPTATQKEIKEAFKQLVILNSGDGSTENPELMKKLNDISRAYSILGHVEKRKKYDEIIRKNNIRQNNNLNNIPQKDTNIMFPKDNHYELFYPSFSNGFYSMSNYIDNHLATMRKNLNNMMKEMEQSFEFKDSFNSINHDNMSLPEGEHKYSKIFKSATYIDNKGQKKTKTLKEINKNGSVYKEMAEIDGNKKTIKRVYPDGKTKVFDSNNIESQLPPLTKTNN